ncbi:MAG: acyltransferase [Colwellia sp.]
MNKRFEALDAFRGLCALSVVVFHMRLIGAVTELDFFRGSELFVEFFFVLSGFVLAHGYGFKKNLNFKVFMKARFFRLYPLHLFMFSFFLCMQVVKLIAFKFGIILGTAPFTGKDSVSEIIPNLLLIQSWTPFTHPHSFNGPSWSISMEFYMYALLFFTIVGFKQYKVFSWFLLSFITLLLIYSNSNILVPEVLRGLSCFFGGAFTYILYQKTQHSVCKINYAVGSTLELILIILVILIVQLNFEYRAIIGPILFFITVLLFAFELGAISKLLKAQFFQYIGKLSYSIYMTHIGVIFCFTTLALIIDKLFNLETKVKVSNIWYLTFGNATVNNLMVLIVITLVIFISSLTYKYIEIIGQRLNKG